MTAGEARRLLEELEREEDARRDAEAHRQCAYCAAGEAFDHQPEPIRDDVESGEVWPEELEPDDTFDADEDAATMRTRAQQARRTVNAGGQPTACVECGAELGSVEQWAGEIECPKHRPVRRL